jgi:hypothetical protein
MTRAAAYALLYGHDGPLAELIPSMLVEFLGSDRDFCRIGRWNYLLVRNLVVFI